VKRLFLYGTLLRHQTNHRVLEGAAFAGDASTVPGYALYDLGAYPAMVAEGNGCVHGELFDVEEGMLARLDRFEGCPHLYARRPVGLAAGTWADAYLQRPEQVRGYRRIESGDWRRHYATRRLARRTGV
jgi:gamma-glutamylcyclotransferase (GGCT)/AIG2-like uncharacterized protein YtfP